MQIAAGLRDAFLLKNGLRHIMRVGIAFSVAKMQLHGQTMLMRHTELRPKSTYLGFLTNLTVRPEIKANLTYTKRTLTCKQLLHARTGVIIKIRRRIRMRTRNDENIFKKLRNTLVCTCKRWRHETALCKA